MTNKLRIALLLDADNLNDEAIQFVVADAKQRGLVVIRRAWGRLNALRGRERTLADLGFEARVALSAARGTKDTADLMLAQDAVRLAERRAVEMIALASSDSDFAAIAQGVHESGLQTLGYGRPTSPQGLREAVSTFVALPEPKTTATDEVKEETSADKLQRVIGQALGDTGSIRVQLLGSIVSREFGKGYKKEFAVNTLSRLIEVTPGFKLEGQGMDARVVREKKR
ncbi:MAG: NYN domain-containing protein [Pseudomonadota bacterium]